MDEEFKKQLMAEIEAILLAKLSGAVQWVSCQHAAAMIDLSVDTIQRRAIPDDDKVGYVDGKIRFKELGLNPGKVGDRRYYAPDVLLLLKTPGCVRRSRI